MRLNGIPRRALPRARGFAIALKCSAPTALPSRAQGRAAHPVLRLAGKFIQPRRGCLAESEKNDASIARANLCSRCFFDKKSRTVSKGRDSAKRPAHLPRWRVQQPRLPGNRSWGGRITCIVFAGWAKRCPSRKWFAKQNVPVRYGSKIATTDWEISIGKRDMVRFRSARFKSTSFVNTS